MSIITELGQIGTVDIPQTFHGSILGHGDGRELMISIPVFGFKLDDEEGTLIWSEPAPEWKKYWQKDEAYFAEVDRRVAAHNDGGVTEARAWFSSRTTTEKISMAAHYRSAEYQWLNDGDIVHIWKAEGRPEAR